jgi:hypothetical protein
MRYVKRCTLYDEETLRLAESLFERFVGRRLSVDMYEETVPIVRHRGQLKHAPVVELLSVKARCDKSEYVPWALDDDISPENVSVNSDGIALPLTLFGEAYTSARVAYLAGMDDIPDDIEACVVEIAKALHERTMDEWSGAGSLSDVAQDTINRYRERR